MATYQGPKIGFRFAEALLPKFTAAGGLDYNIRHVHSDNFQFDYSTYTIQSYATHLRLLAFVNHADLGNYHQTNEAYLDGSDPTPDITAHRPPRYGQARFWGELRTGTAGEFPGFLPRRLERWKLRILYLQRDEQHGFFWR
jgi:hypothetical protein